MFSKQVMKCKHQHSQCTAQSPICSNLNTYLVRCVALCRDLYEAVETANTAVADDVAMDQNPAYGVIEASSKL